ncbi:SDR family oxidoreductase [Flavobacteriaceae bacterium XHP0103]|uniref:SDR family NAD(P)-dependent oxidoreductase n=1 Tax=Marixanthotalea marina TaxID=2844359 RepID=UPI002989FABF|nr:SDR family oxidoreductase [Marixanthotalea marina]MBU3822820.1 SDR family oxidoreductase [Marixanthotalea marina]
MSKNKIALVTGGSRGLGKDMAINIAKKGIDVIITYHSNTKAAEAVIAEVESLGQSCEAFQLDSSNTSQFDEFFNKVSSYLKSEKGTDRFDFLINNAGTGLYELISETSEDQLDAMYNIHFKSVYFLTQKAIPFMNNGGRIINISSGLVRYSFPTASAYACMKGAVEVFTRYLAKELAPRKIAVNTVAPGAIATDFGGGENKTNTKKIEFISGSTALGRMGQPDDIGGVVAFLCTEDAKWVNGQRIEVTGGMLL